MLTEHTVGYITKLGRDIPIACNFVFLSHRTSRLILQILPHASCCTDFRRTTRVSKQTFAGLGPQHLIKMISMASFKYHFSCSLVQDKVVRIVFSWRCVVFIHFPITQEWLNVFFARAQAQKKHRL